MKNMIILAAAALLLSGCDTVNTVEKAYPQASPQMVRDKRIVTDSSLEDYAHPVSVNEGRVNGNLLKIQVELANNTSSYRSFNYKFEWLDENGMAVESPASPWSVLTLEGGERKFVSGVAPNPRVVDFRLKLLPDVRD